MKTIYKSILFIAVATIASMLNFSCNESDDAPYITYVRVTNPDIKDSLLVAAPQGQMIAIIGGNLQNTTEVWFNDQKASLLPGLITNKSIIVTVPSKAPTVVTNQLKLVFSNGNNLFYDFGVTINKPRLDNMFCEYVQEGEKATINGNYFYLPITVTFPGGYTATSESGEVSINEENTVLTVKVPEGATQAGPLSVANNFGTTNSGFWFLDNRNIFQDFDDAGWWGGTQITDPGPMDPSIINGPYYRVTKGIGSWSWTEVFSWWINHNIPDDAILNPKKYNYKFEVNTVKPYNANGIRIWVSDPGMNTNGKFFEWNGTSPGLDTKGQWSTVTFPFEDVMNANDPLGVLPEYFYGFVFCGDGALDCDMCFDNFRIVPKE